MLNISGKGRKSRTWHSQLQHFTGSMPPDPFSYFSLFWHTVGGRSPSSHSIQLGRSAFPTLFVRLLLVLCLGGECQCFRAVCLLLEVRMSCRLVSSSRLQCYPWRYRGACRMLPIQLWFFFESPCIIFCLWCCISVPGICSFPCSRLSVVDIFVCRFSSSHLSSTCSSSDPDFHFYQLIPVAFVVDHVLN